MVMVFDSVTIFGLNFDEGIKVVPNSCPGYCILNVLSPGRFRSTRLGSALLSISDTRMNFDHSSKHSVRIMLAHPDQVAK